METKKPDIHKLVYASVFLALCMLLPFVTGQIPQIGKMLCPMHIPVMLCGIICSWKHGLVVGATAPIMRSLIFSQPKLFPDATGMTFELMTYGIICGILYRIFPKKIGFYYLNITISIICGKLVWGCARFIMAHLQSSSFPIEAFFTYGFINSFPGIILQLVLIPPIIQLASRRENDK